MAFRYWMVILLDLPQRKSQRLKNYDYSQNGVYFITICTNNRVHLFGQIDSGKFILNNAGKMVFDKFLELSEFYPDIIIDKFIVMPNHIHTILLIQHNGTARGPFPTKIKTMIENSSVVHSFHFVLLYRYMIQLTTFTMLNMSSSTTQFCGKEDPRTQ